MPADLPGFYFDSHKGKYFKIHANHVAPKYAQYSRQAVIAERQSQDETAKTKHHDAYIARNRVTQSRYMTSTPGLLLRRQLGETKRNTSTEIVKTAYANDLRGRTVFRNLHSDVFAIEKESKQLFTQTPLSVGWPRTTEFCFTKHTKVEVDDDHEADSDNGDEGRRTERTTYPRNFTIPIYDTTQQLRCIEPINRDLVMWVTREVEAGNARGAGGMQDYVEGVEGSRVHVSRRRDWEWPGEEYGEWGTSVLSAGSMIWDLKVSADGRKAVVAEDESFLVCDLEMGLSNGNLEWRKLGKQGRRRDWMCVGWIGENVAIAGDRSGEVWLADVRVGGGAVGRARCPWAVSAVRSTGHQGILVWGLEGGSVFDLRFNQDEVNRAQKSKTVTKPAISFDVKESWKQKRYGMGWDYYGQLGLVASAATDLYQRHMVGLWDVNSGRMVDDCPVKRQLFPKPVTCISMVDLENGAGVKTLLAACDGKIQAWEV